MKVILQAARPVSLAACLLILASLCLNFLAGRTQFFSASTQQATVVVVNAATFASDSALAPDAIAAAFGVFKTQNDQVFIAPPGPLPTTLGGVKVTVNNVDARLFFTSNSQINFIVPSGTADGTATVTVTNSDNTTRTGTIFIARASPGFFTVRSSGQGLAAAQTTFDGVIFQNVFNPNGTERDVDAGTVARPNFLILYGTGWRNVPATALTLTIQGVPLTITFAGAHPFLEGVDQINAILPPQLAGFGSVRVKLTAAGRVSNIVTIKIAGQSPPLITQTISDGQTIFGALTASDQVQDAGDGSGRTYFFDAYTFSVGANRPVAIDLRSTQFDALLALYRLNSDSSLTLVATDDQTGALGNGRDENGNALLLTVLADSATYVIFVTSANSEPDGLGGYTLRLSTGVITPISYGANITNGIFAAGDLVTSAGDFLDAYSFSGRQGDFVQIKMSSTAVDSFLILNKNNGDLVTFDDNSGGGAAGLDAQISTFLPETGTYIIIATPFEPGRGGNYTLTLNRISGPSVPMLELGQSAALGRPEGERTIRRDSTFDRFATRRVVSRE